MEDSAGLDSKTISKIPAAIKRMHGVNPAVLFLKIYKKLFRGLVVAQPLNEILLVSMDARAVSGLICNAL